MRTRQLAAFALAQGCRIEVQLGQHLAQRCRHIACDGSTQQHHGELTIAG
jgi:hypothetical protein